MTAGERLGWAAVLALPLVALAGRWALDQSDEDARNRPAIARSDAADATTAFAGEVDLSDVGRLSARLVRLHADALAGYQTNEALAAKAGGDAETAALTLAASTILNFDEALTK